MLSNSNPLNFELLAQRVTKMHALRLGLLIVLIIVFWRACSPNMLESWNWMHDNLTNPDSIYDKLLHAITFFLLGIWAQFVFTQYKHKIILIALLSLYGLVIECVQYFVSGRFFSLVDWLMDLLGLGLAILLVSLYQLVRNH